MLRYYPGTEFAVTDVVTVSPEACVSTSASDFSLLYGYRASWGRTVRLYSSATGPASEL